MNLFKGFYLNIIPIKSGQTWQVHFNGFWSKTLFWLLLLFVLLLSGVLLSFSYFFNQAMVSQRLKAQNDKLSQENIRLIRLADEYLLQIHEFDTQIREIIGTSEFYQNHPEIANHIVVPETEPAFENPLLSSEQVLALSRQSFPSCWPVPGHKWISKTFSSVHEGIDIPAQEGTPIVAAATGRVSLVDYHHLLGNVITLTHKNNYQTHYGHCSRIIRKNGDFIKQGEIIAFVGNTGRSSGPHLHFEIRQNATALDPQKYIH